MNARTEVPEWCRTDVEDAISDAVVRWALRHLDHVRGQTDHDAVHDPLRMVRMAISGQRRAVARDVIAALQGVGVPFSGATGAGAEHELHADGLAADLDWIRSKLHSASMVDAEYIDFVPVGVARRLVETYERRES